MIEIIAAALGLIYIVLEYRANVWMWFFCIAMSLLYAWVFWQQKMYANLALDIYNIAISVWGAYTWLRHRSSQADATSVCGCPRWLLWLLGAVVVLLVPLLGWVLRMMGESEAPLLDGLTASLSVVGIWMLAKRYYQQWICWIVADVLYVVMFVNSHMWPSAALYALYVVIAVIGYLHWRKLTVEKKAKE